MGDEIINPATLRVTQQPHFVALASADAYAETVKSQLLKVQLDLIPVADCIYTLNKLYESDNDKRYFQNLLDKLADIMTITSAIITALDSASFVGRKNEFNTDLERAIKKARRDQQNDSYAISFIAAGVTPDAIPHVPAAVWQAPAPALPLVIGGRSRGKGWFYVSTEQNTT